MRKKLYIAYDQSCSQNENVGIQKVIDEIFKIIIRRKSENYFKALRLP